MASGVLPRCSRGIGGDGVHDGYALPTSHELGDGRESRDGEPSRREWPGTFEAFVQKLRDGDVPSGSVSPREVVSRPAAVSRACVSCVFAHSPIWTGWLCIPGFFVWNEQRHPQGIRYSGAASARHEKFSHLRKILRRRRRCIFASNHISVLDEPLMMSLLAGPGRLCDLRRSDGHCVRRK